jgi:hypothetical protein
MMFGPIRSKRNPNVYVRQERPLIRGCHQFRRRSSSVRRPDVSREQAEV